MSVINKKIGIIGGGQLGKMMILEAKRMGFYVVTLDPDADCPSRSVSDELIVAALDDKAAYKRLAEKVDVITYEWELISVAALKKLEADGHIIYPSVNSLEIIQDKFMQKKALREAGVPVPNFKKIHSFADIGIGMLKTTKGGYDGKGTALIRTEADIKAAYAALGGGAKELMLEDFIDFEKEISVIACRAINGTNVIYPIAENIHCNSILDTTVVPARIDSETIEKATVVAEKVMEVFEGVGTFCVEMFVTEGGGIFVNEVAPRPHNSGHYTIEGCFANQFENHIRAIVGLPFGSVELKQPTVMVNLLGQSNGKAELIGAEDAYRENPNIRIHLYGKPESKKARKMGHFTVIDETVEGAVECAERAKEIIKIVGITPQT
ncbi:MAG: 5-(carboxyamino)imidazole ribonucleotide synthase [Oscillospiraceae bacterium]|jgi:5-(carboxyamino)imidazole ribonucleotide synthase|nr:5-(carboxyamino)imidazole ribonucleotide synthase [Oscillospiraceae bacterium]